MAKSKRQVEAISSGMGVFVTIISGLVELVKSFGGSIEDLYHLGTPEGRQKLEAVARIIVGELKEMKTEFLRLISGSENLILDACSGAEILADANDIFSYIDSDLRKWGADQKGQATAGTPVKVYEIEKDAMFSQMFNSLSNDPRRLCLSQNQIISFVNKYRNWLRTDGYGTFFLFESSGQFFVAHLFFFSVGTLRVSVARFGDSFVWSAESRHRLVAPQLA